MSCNVASTLLARSKWLNELKKTKKFAELIILPDRAKVDRIKARPFKHTLHSGDPIY